jgi:hypothetical protein
MGYLTQILGGIGMLFLGGIGILFLGGPGTRLFTGPVSRLLGGPSSLSELWSKKMEIWSKEMDALSKDMEAAKQKAEDERLLPRVPMTFISPKIMMEKLFARRRAWDKDGKLHRIRQAFIGAELYYSSTPLSFLKPSKKYIS